MSSGKSIVRQRAWQSMFPQFFIYFVCKTSLAGNLSWSGSLLGNSFLFGVLYPT